MAKKVIKKDLLLEKEPLTQRDNTKINNTSTNSFVFREPNINTDNILLSNNPMGVSPIIGDILQAGDVALDVSKGNYKRAITNAGLLLVPNILEKTGKFIGKGVKQIIKNNKDKYIKYINESIRKELFPKSDDVYYHMDNLKHSRANTNKKLHPSEDSKNILPGEARDKGDTPYIWFSKGQTYGRPKQDRIVVGNKDDLNLIPIQNTELPHNEVEGFYVTKGYKNTNNVKTYQGIPIDIGGNEPAYVYGKEIFYTPKKDINTQNEISLFKMGGKQKRTIYPNIIRGGAAIPLGDNIYLLKGKKHSQGGIDIGKDLEAEGDEVVKMNPKSIKVVTAQKIMGGKSPAELVVNASSTGEQDKVFNDVFKYQEKFKDRNNLNDDGTKKAKFGKEKKYVELTPSEAIAHNKMTPNNAFMYAIGDENNPEFLYPEELESAIVTANLAESNKNKIEKEVKTFRNRDLKGYIGDPNTLNLGDNELQDIAGIGIGTPLVITNPATYPIFKSAGHVGKTMINPKNAITGIGQGITTTADIGLTIQGLKDANKSINNIVQGQGNLEDYFNVITGVIGPFGTINGIKALKYNPLLKYNSEVLNSFNIEKKIQGHKVVNDIPQGYNESGKPIFVKGLLYQQFINDKGKKVYKFIGPASEFRNGRVSTANQIVDNAINQRNVDIVEEVSPGVQEQTIINDARIEENLPDWVTHTNLDPLSAAGIYPSRPLFGNSRNVSNNRVNVDETNSPVRNIIQEATNVTNNPSIVDENIVNEINNVINNARGYNAYYKAYFANRDLIDKKLFIPYLEHKIGKPINEILGKYFLIQGDNGNEILTNEQVVKKFRDLGWNDKAIKRELIEYTSDLNSINEGTRNYLPRLEFKEPIFEDATQTFRINKSKANPETGFEYLFDNNYNLNLNSLGGLGNYYINKNKLNKEDAEILNILIEKYNKENNKTLSIDSIFENEDNLGEFRNYYRKYFKTGKLPGDIHHMGWFQGGTKSGYKVSDDYINAASKVNNDVSTLMKSIPRGYSLAETNTSFDSEMLKLLYSLKSRNYGRGKGQFSLEFNTKYGDVINIDSGNTLHKERIYVTNILDKYKHSLNEKDISILEEIINRGKDLDYESSKKILNEMSPELKEVIKNEFNNLGINLQNKMQSVWNRLIQKDELLKDAPAISYDELTDFDIQQFIRNGNITPTIRRPSVRIQKNKLGGKTQFKYGGMKQFKDRKKAKLGIAQLISEIGAPAAAGITQGINAGLKLPIDLGSVIGGNIYNKKYLDDTREATLDYNTEVYDAQNIYNTDKYNKLNELLDKYYKEDLADLEKHKIVRKDAIYNPVKLNTKINITEPLQEIARTRDRNIRSIIENSGSSKDALNRIRQEQLLARDKNVAIQSQKENIEKQLQNADITQRQKTYEKQIEANLRIDELRAQDLEKYFNNLANIKKGYNQNKLSSELNYLQDKYNTENLKRTSDYNAENLYREGRRENRMNLIQGISDSMGQFFNEVNNSAMTMAKLQTMQNAYGNNRVNPQTSFSPMGIQNPTSQYFGNSAYNSANNFAETQAGQDLIQQILANGYNFKLGGKTKIKRRK